MSAATAPNWLRNAYAVALVLHAVFVVLAIGLVIYAAATVDDTANAADGGSWLSAALVTIAFSPAIPSTVALLSWNICRQRGWTPTQGHMGLVVAAAALILVFIIVSYAS